MLESSLQGAWLALCLVAWLVLPGAAVLRLAGVGAKGLKALALAIGLSLTQWPLLLLWTTQLGWTWGRLQVWLLLALSAAVLLWRRSRVHLPWARLRDPLTIGWLWILALAMATRLSQVSGLVVPPWVDGYHHSLVSRLVFDLGAVPSDYQPYLDVAPFYYHFGFHALIAAVAWLSGLPIPSVTLGTGQALNVASVLAVYVLGEAMTGRRLGGLIAASLPAALFWLPAYFLSWGRYTQLAGLTALPAVWLLLHASLRARWSWRRALLAASAAAGLLLTHYRVTAFFAVGAAILAIGGAIERHRDRDRAAAAGRFVRLATVGLASLTLASPWIVYHMLPGLRSLQSASADWYTGARDTAVQISAAPPEWLFTWSSNGLWIRLALIGLAAGLLRLRRPALALLGWLLACLALVAPQLLGLPASWLLPPFALAISLFLPVGIGLAIYGNELATGLSSRSRIVGFWVLAAQLAALAMAWRQRHLASPIDDGLPALLLYALAAIAIAAVSKADADLSPRIEWSVVALVLIVASIGAWQMRVVVRDETIIAQTADLEAADWIRAHTTPEARFLINSAHWHLGTFRGLDGGYWLPLTADRATSLPAALYTHGSSEQVRAITELAEQTSRGDALDDRELAALMDQAKAGWIYLGPASASRSEAFTKQRLQRHPELQLRYDSMGVSIFERVVLDPG